jgi:NAD(P)-dependent dehydrogenase (short-subunit alcohol dehydrogenase family)
MGANRCPAPLTSRGRKEEGSSSCVSNALPPPPRPCSRLTQGFAYKGDVFGADEAAATIGVNYRGTAAATEALAPLLIPYRGRVVNVSSS